MAVLVLKLFLFFMRVYLYLLMPATSGVEGDFSLSHYRRNEYISVLTDFALEGVLHANQLRDLQSVVLKDLKRSKT